MNMANETISEKCETLYNKLNAFVTSVISRDVTPKISNLNTEVWGSDTQTGNSRIDTLNTNFNNLDGSITTMESDINNVKSNINNVESDVSNLQTSVNSLSDSITNIGSFEKVAGNATYELWVNTTTRCARILAHRTNITILSGETFNNYDDFKIPSTYRPKKSFFRLIMRSNQFIFYLYDDGSYGIYNTGSRVDGYNINFQIDYTF